LMESVVSVAPELVDHPRHAEAILDALSRPYSAYQLEEVRRLAYVAATWRSGRCSPRNLGALSAMEPHAVWMKPILEMRVRCYENAALTQMALRAKQDLKEFEAGEKILRTAQDDPRSRVTSSSAQSARASPPL
jgi:hypothetical protein